MVQTLPFGSWPSPISAADAASASPRLDGARFVGDEIWWAQTVPAEGGRTTVRRRAADGSVSDLLRPPLSARSRVHEYGGGVWDAADDGALVYVEKTDQRVWERSTGGTLRPLTPESDDVRMGGLVAAADTVLAIRETHGGTSPRRDIVAIPRDGSAAADAAAVRSVVAGSDFLAHPTLSPDGTRLAWVAWDHPDMPWDRSEIRVGDLVDGRIERWSVVAAGDGRAPLQPEWIGPDELVFADDATGRWNLYRARPGDEPVALSPVDADTGGGLWVLGTRWFAPLPDGRIVAVRTDGADEIVLLDTEGRATALPVPVVAGAAVEDVRGTSVLVSGAAADGGTGLWRLDVDSDAAADPVVGGTPAWEDGWTPTARPLTVSGPTGAVHAFAYPPTSPAVRAPDGELPPYLVLVHGGPTAHVGPAASAKIAFFTSRGIGVLDVNYGGSTGYGRAYRERLRGQWGVVDVDDVAAAARGLVEAGLADPARLAIEGGSAGGWTVLGALVRTDAFSAGISRYGVGDARALAADSHDFEARYLDGLIAPLPEGEALYVERSPLSHAERFRVPLLILQGTEDPVVPPAQAEAIRDTLAARGIPHAYVLYEGEGHGFRRAETVVHALETELAFLGAVFGFHAPGVAPLTLS